MIAHILAMARNGVIGRDNKIPWRISEDFEYFKKITMQKPVIMGRKTWDSLEQKPLPGRKNIVVTRNPENVHDAGGGSYSSFHSNICGESVEKFKDFEDIEDIDNNIVICASLEKALKTAGSDCFIIGGADIYRQTADICNRIYLTFIDEDFEGDACYNKNEINKYSLVSEEKGLKTDQYPYDYYFRVYERPIHSLPYKYQSLYTNRIQ